MDLRGVWELAVTVVCVVSLFIRSSVEEQPRSCTTDGTGNDTTMIEACTAEVYSAVWGWIGMAKILMLPAA